MAPHREVAMERAQAQIRALLFELHEAGIDAYATLMVGDRSQGVRMVDAGPNYSIYEGCGPTAYAHEVMERIA